MTECMKEIKSIRKVQLTENSFQSINILDPIVNVICGRQAYVGWMFLFLFFALFFVCCCLRTENKIVRNEFLLSACTTTTHTKRVNTKWEREPSFSGQCRFIFFVLLLFCFSFHRKAISVFSLLLLLCRQNIRSIE